MNNTNGQIGRNVFSVVAGVLTSSALFMLAGLIMLLFIASKTKGHGEESDFGDTSTISAGMIAATFVSCAMGGFVTGRVSTKSDVIHGCITAAVLIFLLAYISDFKFTNSEAINYLLIIPFTLTGTWLAIKMKKRNQY